MVATVNTPVLIHLVATDFEEDPLTYSVVDPPVSGSLSSDDGDYALIYTPLSGFEGDDTFTYRAQDQLSESNEATVRISVRQPGLFEDAFETGDTSAWSLIVE